MKKTLFALLAVAVLVAVVAPVRACPQASYGAYGSCYQAPPQVYQAPIATAVTTTKVVTTQTQVQQAVAPQVYQAPAPQVYQAPAPCASCAMSQVYQSGQSYGAYNGQSYGGTGCQGSASYGATSNGYGGSYGSQTYGGTAYNLHTQAVRKVVIKKKVVVKKPHR